jgi:hypothetical protein
VRKFGEDAAGIIKRCHDGGGVIWCAPNRTSKFLWFLSSGRHYPVNPRRDLLSSTEIRRLINTVPSGEVYDCIKDMPLNSDILLIVLRLNTNRKRWDAFNAEDE